jgi:ribonuclease HII
MLEFEERFWSRGVRRLAGVDEVGRGPLAGPVVAAAVVFEPELAADALRGPLAGLTDSKRLTAAERERYHAALVSHPGVRIGLGVADSAEIDAVNILRATHAAMARALAALPEPAEHALVDGLPPRGLGCESTAIVGGDGLSLSIAAASVVAKVVRDRWMVEQDRAYPVYGFAAHKGYGTSAHIQALFEYGPCPLHRRSFRPVREAEAIFRRRAASHPEAEE